MVTRGEREGNLNYIIYVQWHVRCNLAMNQNAGCALTDGKLYFAKINWLVFAVALEADAPCQYSFDTFFIKH